MMIQKWPNNEDSNSQAFFPYPSKVEFKYSTKRSANDIRGSMENVKRKGRLKTSACLTSGYFLVLGLKRVDGDGVFQVDVEGVSCGHQVLVVHELDEALDARFLGGFLGGVLADDLARVLFYPRDQTVAIGTVTCAVVEGFYDHGFASGVTALEDNDSFVGL
ncbi:hypothetical protein GOBAR_DD00924 [Gossypium barbadense]|nr:hypothetical protein GOBAR_DD00924 [Gossypium barbadense]